MKKKPLTLFYLAVSIDGEVKPLLHRKLHINRGTDTITTWCYPLHKRIAYTYTHVKRTMEKAFTTSEVAKMLNRRREVIERAIIAGNITPPQKTYGIDENKNPHKYMWHESNIMEAHRYFSSVHVGRPRKDGLITPFRMPNERELRAIIRNNEVLYVKVGDEFRPVWQAQDFS